MSRVHDIDLWVADGNACWAADDDFIQDIVEGRLYSVDDGEMFLGTLAQFEDCFGGCQGREDVLFSACAYAGWALKIIDEEQI